MKSGKDDNNGEDDGCDREGEDDEDAKEAGVGQGDDQAEFDKVER